jgi:pilus assembly protein FimV
MNRKLALAVASACMVAPAPLYALGLGAITLHSHLDEKLNADIRLYSDNPGELDGALVSLAAPSAFARAGIGRPFVLSDLHFKVLHNVKGHPAIQVTSDRPIREPFLDFIVEVGWRNGRILRQYTVLLNPPTMTALRPAGVHPAAAAAVTRTPAVPVVTPLAGGAPPVAGVGAPPPRRGAVQRAGTPQPSGVARGTIRTARNDTLWGIARRVRPNNRVSIEQTMLALLDANPQAFYDHNINRLKAGYVLRVPDVSQVLGIDPQRALAQVHNQNLLWERYRRRLARVATGVPRAAPHAAGAKPGAGVSSAAQQEQERLRLLAPKAGEAVATGAPGGTAGVNRRALKDRLALANEAAVSKAAEAKNLQGRVNTLQDQVGRLKELLSLKNQQLADLQARSGAGAVAVPPAPAKPAAVTSPAEASKAAPVPESAPRHSMAPAPARVQTPPPASRVGSLRELLNNRGVLAMLGGAFLALVALIWLVIRRRRSTESGLPLEAESRALADSETTKETDGETSGAEIFAQTLGDEQEVSGAAVAEAGGDALAEAEIYLAYGRYEQAAEQLAQAVREEPERADLKAKLLEAYHALADRDAFESTAEALYADLGDTSHPLWQDVAQWGAELCPEHPLFRREAGTAAESSAEAGPVAEAQGTDALPEAGVESTDTEESTGEAVDELLRSLVAELPPQEGDEEHPAAAPVDEAAAADRSQGLPGVPELETSGDLSEEPSGAQEQGEADSGAPRPDTEPETFEEAHAPEQAAEEAPIEEAAAVEKTPEPAESNVIEWEGGLTSGGAARTGEEAAGEEAATEEAVREEAATTGEVAGEEAVEEKAATEETVREEAAEGEAAGETAGGAGEDAVLGEPDEVGTKLDLARAYLDMGDREGARELLAEVIEEGSDPQREEAESLMQQLSA